MSDLVRVKSVSDGYGFDKDQTGIAIAWLTSPRGVTYAVVLGGEGKFYEVPIDQLAFTGWTE